MHIYGEGLNPPFPAVTMNFNTSLASLNYMDVPNIGTPAELTMCNEKGDPIFYSNGYNIYYFDGSLMVNGDSLAPIAFESFAPGGYFRLGMMFLPMPGHPNNYYVLQLFTEPNWSYTPKILLSLIEGATSSGSGSVAYKNKLVFEGHNRIDFFNATKHANGRDWWVVFSDIDTEAHTRIFYSYCITPDTVYQAQSQEFAGYEPVPDHPWEVYTIQRVFSPDGKYFISLDPIHGIRLHSFDRCTGELGLLTTLPYQISHLGAAGVAVSPNSRYLYAANREFIFQYDLAAPDIASTKDTVEAYDGYLDPPAGIPTNFGYPQLAPDGKIYYFIDGLRWIHVITRPNKRGGGCRIKQRAFQMTVAAEGIPYYPNYRLGPIDGSSCDSLGLDNEPLADFWWFADSTLSVEFSDNSSYEPAQWHWDFGDGGISQDTSPVHVFPGAGTYYVCLTVSNQYASDTICKEVTVGGGSVPTKEPGIQADGTQWTISPNPAQNKIVVQFFNIPEGASQLEIFDIAGTLKQSIEVPMNGGAIEISTLGYNDGIYFCRWISNHRVVSTSKFSILH